jgi:hypothetical protein
VKKASTGSRDPVVDGRRVEFVPVSARRLVTIDVGGGREPMLHADEVRGAIIRVRPAADTPPAEIERARLALMESGAEAVHVVPAPRAAPLPDEAVEAPVRTADVRAVVGELVAASNVEDRAKLLALCEEIMSENGL